MNSLNIGIIFGNRERMYNRYYIGKMIRRFTDLFILLINSIIYRE